MELYKFISPPMPDAELKRSRCLTHKIDIVEIDELLEWVDLWESIQQHDCSESDAKSSGWVFRGQSDPSWKIASSIERGATSSCSDERSLIARFKKRMMEYYAQVGIVGVADRFDTVTWLSVMQHYGLKTRLIDFTFSPVIALYMAARDTVLRQPSSRPISVWAVYRGRYPSVYSSRFPFFWASERCSRALCSCDDFYEEQQRIEPTAKNVWNGNVSNRLCCSCLIDKGNSCCAEQRFNFPKILWIVGVNSEDINVRMRAQRGLFMMSTNLERSSMEQLFWQPLPWVNARGEVEVFASREFARIAITDDLVAKSHLFQFRFSGALHDAVVKLLKDKNIDESTMFPAGTDVLDRGSKDVAENLKSEGLA